MDTPATADATVEKGIQHLERIEEELEEIKERTADPKRSVLNGMLSGAGAIVGSLAALVILGWLLSLIGLLPGFGTLAVYLHGFVDKLNARY